MINNRYLKVFSLACLSLALVNSAFFKSKASKSARRHAEEQLREAISAHDAVKIEEAIAGARDVGLKNEGLFSMARQSLVEIREEMRQQLGELSNKLQEAQQREIEAGVLREKYDELRVIHENCEESVGSLKSNSKKLEEMLTDKDHQIKELLERIKEVSGPDVEVLKGQLEEANKKVEELTEELEGLALEDEPVKQEEKIVLPPEESFSQEVATPVQEGKASEELAVDSTVMSEEDLEKTDETEESMEGAEEPLKPSGQEVVESKSTGSWSNCFQGFFLL